ncbi:glycosyltransferase [Ruicaihuangia caeni]|uniref:glycosyltransferase n=1 Tax=Ruicaihuangia caeni TaxID=3042517 RepID=UPI00338D60DD
MIPSKTALVAVESNISRDPRVRRQVDWLVDDGWVVDTIGLGPSSTQTVRDHFELGSAPKWTRGPLGSLLAYGLLRRGWTFAALTRTRIPPTVRDRVRSGGYDLIILNDRHFTPWVADRRDFGDANRSTHVHLDLHEYFPQDLRGKSLWARLAGPSYRWARKTFAHPRFDSRSTVNTGISRLYAGEFGIPEPAVIRNSPPFVEQSPSPVVDSAIRLLHHGIASWDRGLRQMVDAVRMCEPRFSLTLMLLGDQGLINELKDYAADLGDRVRVVPPAPMEELSRVVNDFDIEIMFYRPTTRNLELALPNKFFEAVQGRLGLIVGESPMMAEIVREYQNGVVVSGWDAADLARALDAVTVNDVVRFKAASERAAQDLNADVERSVFLSVVAGERAKGQS